MGSRDLQPRRCGRIQAEFQDDQRAIVQSLADKEALVVGVDVDGATDILWRLTRPNLYALLARERRWSPERYEWLLGDLLCSQLLSAVARKPADRLPPAVSRKRIL